MKKKSSAFERSAHDLSGAASVDLFGHNFSALAENLMGSLLGRLEPIAIKIYAKKSDVVITIFAMDHEKRAEKKKIPVKKIKRIISWDQLMPHIKNLELVVSVKGMDISEMLVTNK